MTERFPDGSDPWQDGDVLTASDLNDTIDALGDGIDTIGEESQENRLLINLLQFQTSADADGDSTNSFADIATDSDGFRDSINSSNITHFTSSTTVNSFIYPEVVSDYTITQTSVSTNSSMVAQTWDPNNNELVIVTSTSYSSGSLTVNYEVYDNAGNNQRSNSVTFSSTNLGSGVTLSEQDCRTVLSDHVAIFINDTENSQGWVGVFDHVNSSTTDQVRKGESLDPDSIISSCGDTGGSIGFIAVGASGATRAFDVDNSSLTSVLNANYNSSADLVCAGYDDSGNAFISQASCDDIDGSAMALKNGDSSDTSSFSDSSGSNSRYLDDQTLFAENGTSRSVSINLKTGSVASGQTVSSPQHDNIGSSEYENYSAFNNTEAIFRMVSGNTNINNHITVDVSGLKHEDGGSILNDDPTSLPLQSSNSWPFSGDDKFYQVDNPSSKTARINELEGQTIKNPNFQLTTNSVTTSDDGEYVNVKIYETGSNDIDQYQLVDGNANTVIGTFNEQEKIYVGDQNTDNFKVRVENSEMPTKTGFNAYSVLVW